MDEVIVRDAIQALYQGAGIQKRFTGEVNEQVAEVFGTMLAETRRCSSSLSRCPGQLEEKQLFRGLPETYPEVRLNDSVIVFR